MVCEKRTAPFLLMWADYGIILIVRRIVEELFFERDIYKNMLEWKKERETGFTPKALEVRGARQVGKTVILNKFAKENYKKVIIIHLGLEKDLRKVRDWEKRVGDPYEQETEFEYNMGFLRMFSNDFVDSPDTVIIIDEIQESNQVYQLIPKITRLLNAHLIVTGSNLGKVLNSKEFEIPEESVCRLSMTSLSFMEFLDIFKERELYDSLDLFGASLSQDYWKIHKRFDTYMRVGGYPSVLREIITKSDATSWKESSRIVDMCVEEVSRYFANIIDINLFPDAMACVANLVLGRTPVNEFSGELATEIFKRDSVAVTQDEVLKISCWLEQSYVLTYNRAENRYYFTDLGFANRVLRTVQPHKDLFEEILAEHFVFLACGDTMPYSVNIEGGNVANITAAVGKKITIPLYLLPLLALPDRSVTK